MTTCIFCGHRSAPGRRNCESCGAELARDIPADSPLEAGGDVTDANESISEDPFTNEVLGTLMSKGKISAIKLYRERTGVGLREAKEAVEALERRAGIKAERGAGCATVLLLLLAVGCGAGWMLF